MLWRQAAQRRGWTSNTAQVHVLTACNEYRQETVILERSATANGYRFHPLGLNGPWAGLGTKLLRYDQALKELIGNVIGPADPVLLLDAWDTVLLGPATELRDKLGELGVLGSPLAGDLSELVLCAGDRLCAPEYRLAPQMERLYPGITTPWRYPNSGGLAGTAVALLSFLHRLVHGLQGGAFSEDADDQLRLQTFVLGCAWEGQPFPLLIDEACSVFQCMGEPECGWDYEQSCGKVMGSPRIKNRETGERPLVAHGCGGHGRWFLADVYRELRLLEFLGLDKQDLENLPYAGLVPPGCSVTQEHWVGQPPWEFPFQLFEAIRTLELKRTEADPEEEPPWWRQSFPAVPLAAHTRWRQRRSGGAGAQRR